MLYTKSYETPLGKMVAFANQNALLLLDFEDSKYFEKHMEEISQRLWRHQNINNRVLKLLEKGIEPIFQRKIDKIYRSCRIYRYRFSEKVWEELQNISFGEYRSYQSQADAMKRLKIGKSSCQCQF